MSTHQARTLREAGIKVGSAVIRSAPRILESVQATIAAEEVEQVDVLIRVMAGFDRDTAEHLESVGTMSMLLAHRVDLPADVVGTCLLAGRVHDIGKLAISRGILLKPGHPTKSEWVELKLHPVYGGSTLSGLPRLKHLAPIVIAHHERMDGNGYPYRLAADEIPIESQIVAIADAFCAQTCFASLALWSCSTRRQPNVRSGVGPIAPDVPENPECHTPGVLHVTAPLRNRRMRAMRYSRRAGRRH